MEWEGTNENEFGEMLEVNRSEATRKKLEETGKELIRNCELILWKKLGKKLSGTYGRNWQEIG